MALSKGKPFEWKDIRQSQMGHSSTGFCKHMTRYINLIIKSIKMQQRRVQALQPRLTLSPTKCTNARTVKDYEYNLFWLIRYLTPTTQTKLVYVKPFNGNKTLRHVNVSTECMYVCMYGCYKRSIKWMKKI